MQRPSITQVVADDLVAVTQNTTTPEQLVLHRDTQQSGGFDHVLDVEALELQTSRAEHNTSAM